MRMLTFLTLMSCSLREVGQADFYTHSTIIGINDSNKRGQCQLCCGILGDKVKFLFLRVI